MRIRETWLDADQGWNLGSSDWYEPYTDDRGALFRAMQREYGGCVSKIYAEVPQGDASANPGIASPASERQRYVTEARGWVFAKRVPYSDAPTTFLRETWVEVQP